MNLLQNNYTPKQLQLLQFFLVFKKKKKKHIYFSEEMSTDRKH